MTAVFLCSVILAYKVKVHPRIGYEGPEGKWRHSSTVSLTFALDGDGWSMPRPGHFTPRKETRYPLCRKLGGPQSWSRQLQKILPPQGPGPLAIQPVVSRYRNYIVMTHILTNNLCVLKTLYKQRISHQAQDIPHVSFTTYRSVYS
jgi:hypothetical protein